MVVRPPSRKVVRLSYRSGDLGAVSTSPQDGGPRRRSCVSSALTSSDAAASQRGDVRTDHDGGDDRSAFTRRPWRRPSSRRAPPMIWCSARSELAPITTSVPPHADTVPPRRNASRTPAGNRRASPHEPQRPRAARQLHTHAAARCPPAALCTWSQPSPLAGPAAPSPSPDRASHTQPSDASVPRNAHTRVHSRERSLLLQWLWLALSFSPCSPLLSHPRTADARADTPTNVDPLGAGTTLGVEIRPHLLALHRWVVHL